MDISLNTYYHMIITHNKYTNVDLYNNFIAS